MTYNQIITWVGQIVALGLSLTAFGLFVHWLAGLSAKISEDRCATCGKPAGMTATTSSGKTAEECSDCYERWVDQQW